MKGEKKERKIRNVNSLPTKTPIQTPKPLIQNSQKKQTHHQPPRKTQLKRQHVLNLLYIFIRQVDIEGLDVGEEVFDFAAAHDGEAVWGFVEDVGYCDWRV